MALTDYERFEFNAYDFWLAHQDTASVYMPDIAHWYMDRYSSQLDHQCRLLWCNPSDHTVFDETNWTSATHVAILLCDMQGEEPNFVNSITLGGEDYFIGIILGVKTADFVTAAENSQNISVNVALINVTGISNNGKSIYVKEFCKPLISNGTDTYVQSSSNAPAFAKVENDPSDEHATFVNKAVAYLKKPSFGFIGGTIASTKRGWINWDQYDSYFLLAGGIVLEMYDKANPQNKLWCLMDTSVSTLNTTYPKKEGTSGIANANSSLKSGAAPEIIMLIPFSIGNYVNDDFYTIPTYYLKNGNPTVFTHMRDEKEFMMKNLIQVGKDHYTALKYVYYVNGTVETPILCIKNGEEC